jgi:hypothetical protein
MRFHVALFRILIVGTGCLTSPAVEAQDEMLRRLQNEFNQSVKPILQKYCLDCHSGESALAGFDLDQFNQLDQIFKARKRWKKLEQHVIKRVMPPADETPLDDKSYQTLTTWIDSALNSADCTNLDPGRVTLRRLNRIEYRNTIRDLLGVDYQPADSFPGDDVGYGFDNIADVISLPPILMEKYLSAAEEVTAQAILDTKKKLLNQLFLPQQIQPIDGVRIEESQVVFFRKASVETELWIPQTGNYRIVVRAAGDQAGAEPVQMSLRLKGQKRLLQRKVTNQPEKPSDFEFKLRLIEGKQRLQLSFLNDYFKQREDGSAEDRNLFVYQIAIEGPDKPRLPATHLKLIGETIPEGETEQIQKAEEILLGIGSRGFRRRMTEGERDRLMEIFNEARAEGESFEMAIRYVLQAILISPHFLFKVEVPPEPGTTRELNDFELATSLSYFLWSTMPDDDLFRAAVEGKLRQPEHYRQQVQRMLADPKSNALTENFVSQWLQLRKLEQFEPDPTKFPEVDLQLRRDMITETKLLVDDLIRNNHRVLDLLSVEYTFVNQRLAGHYGLPEVPGEQFRKVSTAETGRVGLLSQASILTVTSNPTRTSPVKRGKWIMENLLGEEPPPADPAAMPIEDQPKLSGTIRQRTEQHRADPNCAACHKVMDQLGFALENFDAVGRWRNEDEGAPIDASGELPTGQRFSSPMELQRVIRDDLREDFVRCLTEKLLIYATGRGLEYFDECAVDKILEELKQQDYSFVELIHRITTSEPFIKRRG